MKDHDVEIIGLRQRVCIGMPVKNGQQYIAQAIESILSQTFTEIELIISDNASTDGTEDVCREYAARDRRIIYSRLPRDFGAVANFNRVYNLSGGQYFKWASHDDVIEPTYIQECVDALDRDPSAVLAYPRAAFIDSSGRYLGDCNDELATDSYEPQVRFDAIATASHKDSHNLEIYGLMRRSAVDQIPSQGAHAASDRVFLARLALYGRFIQIPQVLFLSRGHSQQSARTLPEYLQNNRSWVTRMVGHGQLPSAEWFDPRLADKITLPEWRLLWEYARSINFGWLNARQRGSCIGSLILRQFMHGNWARMVRDFVLAGDKLLVRALNTVHEPAPQILARPETRRASKAA